MAISVSVLTRQYVSEAILFLVDVPGGSVGGVPGAVAGHLAELLLQTSLGVVLKALKPQNNTSNLSTLYWSGCLLCYHTDLSLSLSVLYVCI